jgi:hypothetical protein
MVNRLRKEVDSIMKLGMVQKDLSRAQGFLESGVEDVKTVTVRKHVPLNDKQEELVDVHHPIL